MISFNVKDAIYTCCPRILRTYLYRIEASEVGYRLVRGAFWSFVGAAISRGMMLMATIVVARLLGREIFGELGIIQSTIGMFAVFAGFGMGLTSTKHIAEFRKTDPERAGRVMMLTGVVALVVSTLMALVLAVLSPWLALRTLDAPHLAETLRIASLILLITAVNGAQTGVLAGFEAFKTIARVNFFVGICSFPLMVGGALLGGLNGAVWGIVACQAVNWGLNHWAIRCEARRADVPFSFSGCAGEMRVLWSFSLPMVLAGALGLQRHSGESTGRLRRNGRLQRCPEYQTGSRDGFGDIVSPSFARSQRAVWQR